MRSTKKPDWWPNCGLHEQRRIATGKCEGRKSWAEINPELVRQAKRLRRRSPKGHQRSLRDVAAELAKLGFVNQRGAEFSASSVQSSHAKLLIDLAVEGSLLHAH